MTNLKKKKSTTKRNEVSASERINFHPDGRVLGGPNPSFPVSYSPSSQEAAPVAFERCTARKSSRGWLEKAASFQVFPLGACSPRPRIAPRASLVTRKNKRDQLAASRLKSENWEERGGGRRPPSGRANFLRFWKAPPRSPLFFFLFSFQRNVIDCCARGNFMKLPDFWPGSNFTKIWNSIRRRDSITRVISLRSFVNKNFRSREKLV